MGALPEDLPGDWKAARDLQQRLRKRVIQAPLGGPIRRIAGVDAAFTQTRVVAVATLFSYPELERIEEGIGIRPLEFPYIPGLLSFREGPAVLEAIGGLRRSPDLLLFDGQGIAHPRRLGIASHLGVLLDRPTVGVGKTRLTGHADEGNLPRGKGANLPLVEDGEVLGALLRSRDGVRPLYVSPGHRVTVAEAAAWTLACCTRYRLPEPVRRADRAAAQQKAGLQSGIRAPQVLPAARREPP